jgi:choline-sulfatase
VSEKTNILIVMVDQLAPAFLPAYGHRLVKAPNIAALAARGTVFTNAYCNSPLCAPSRAVFMTGQLPSRTGVYDNAAEFSADIPTFAHYARRLGYRTILSGKMHFCGPDQLHGFEERLTTDIYPADYGWTPDWDHPGERPDWYHNMSSVADAGVCVRTNQIDFDDEVMFAAERALHDHVRSADRRPFLMVASLTHPHDPFAITRDYWDFYDHAEIDMPRITRAEVAADPHTKRLRHVCAMDAATVTEEDVRRARHAYYGAISYVDANLGRLSGALAATGLAGDTLVLFLGDHGEMLGERGLWYKMSFFEGSARVPLIVAGPGCRAGHRVAAAVSLKDICPTILAMCGGAPDTDLAAPIDGVSLIPHLRGTPGPDGVEGEYLAEGAVAPIVMLRRGRWKFIHSPADPDQLYDLAADPDERSNVADRESAVTTAFRDEVARRWDLGALDRAVRASQRRRRFIDSALGEGVRHAWDHQPFIDASKSYVRNTIALDDLEARARFPRVGPEA